MSPLLNTLSSSFHLSPSGPGSPLTSPVSPAEPHPPSPHVQAEDSSLTARVSFARPSSGKVQEEDASYDAVSPSSTDSFAPSTGSASASARPPPAARGQSFNPASDHYIDRQRRVSYSAHSPYHALNHGNGISDQSIKTVNDDIWGPNRTTRAASDGVVLNNGTSPPGQPSGNSSNQSPPSGHTPSLPKRGSDASVSAGDANEHQERAALFREHERRSLETLAQARLGSSSARDFAQHTSPTSNGLVAPSSFFQPPTLGALNSSNQPLSSPPAHSDAHGSTPSLAENGDARTNASLHLGELDAWMMDEAYIRECCARMGWDSVQHIKLIRGSSPSSGYCFLTFASAAQAAQVLARFNASPPVLMPRSGRMFKLNWGTGLPGLQPRWSGEHSVFVGDLGRDVGEADLVNLFTPIFPSTKSAKVMCDPSTGFSRGYGFVRFAEESDMQRALLIGQNPGSGLSLHGRTLRISEASGPGQEGRTGAGLSGLDRIRTRSRSSDGGLPGPLTIQPGFGGMSNASYNSGPQNDLASPTATSNSYPDFLSPTFSGAFSPNGPMSGATSPYAGANKPLSPSLGNLSAPEGQRRFLTNIGGPAAPGSSPADPNNTTVFVGGLPACISEETLKSFFHHFGEITYCKIPAGKGCGFVQFVRRQDAELAIAKMNDFPIHGKSRIRLSWGRSQGDKQVEHVRKLASALGVPFEAVWRMVQGQDNSTIKQITTAVGSGSNHNGPSSHLAARQLPSGGGGGYNAHPQSNRGDRLDVGAVASVASAAGLTEAEVLDLMGGRSQVGGAAGPPLSAHRNEHGGEQFTRNPGFGPPSGARSFNPSSYAQTRADPYMGHAPVSPYANIDLAEGSMRPQERFSSFSRYAEPPMPQAYNPNFGAGNAGGAYGAQYGGYEYQDRVYTTMPPPMPGTGLEDSFANLGFGSSVSPRSLAAESSHNGTPSFHSLSSSLIPNASRNGNVNGAGHDGSAAHGGSAPWSSGWNGVHA
ncbi:BQ5605_C004g02888 [Microbotryum silenes-dioicae]|uniref:BQ5605_C004g02888 protein n=1 Tax=Microbotryum silenes-dioicae TaxID=796604 RepID=A0A2X0MDL3_9BASI|nr:BQ5605_C004g02888 [Microbotryum silenes-dioicae]